MFHRPIVEAAGNVREASQLVEAFQLLRVS